MRGFKRGKGYQDSNLQGQLMSSFFLFECVTSGIEVWLHECHVSALSGSLNSSLISSTWEQGTGSLKTLTLKHGGVFIFSTGTAAALPYHCTGTHVSHPPTQHSTYLPRAA